LIKLITLSFLVHVKLFYRIDSVPNYRPLVVVSATNELNVEGRMNIE